MLIYFNSYYDGASRYISKINDGIKKKKIELPILEEKLKSLNV